MIKPDPSPFFETWFMRYIRWDLSNTFHHVYTTGALPQIEDDGKTPLIVCLNHSGWWDVMLGVYVESVFFKWERYAVIDERQLMRYRFFTKLGLIGVDRTSLIGAREFLDFVQSLLKDRKRSLWLTPQGEFRSNYDRPIVFQSGVSHIAAALDRFYFTTIALHYEFWNERKPEAFVSFSPVELIETGSDFNRKQWLHHQECRLEAQLDALLALVEARDPSLFDIFLSGKTGTNPLYDATRALTARLKGEKFTSEHGGVESPKYSDKK